MNKDEKKITSGNHLSSITGSLPFDEKWIVGAIPVGKIPIKLGKMMMSLMQD